MILAGRYQLDGQLGQGGMSTVFAATDLRTEKRVAVKRVSIVDEAMRGWFKRELKALALIDHPGVPRLLDHGEDDAGEPFMVTELLDGVNLQQLVQRTGPLADSALVLLLQKILSALAAAHARGVVHRDIKPENIFQCNDGRVVLLDFGVARGEGSDSRTMAKSFGTQLAGTAHYTAPEQLQGVTLSARSDLYSLGGTAFFLATGRVPYPGTAALDIFQKILTSDRPLVKDAAPALAPATAAFIERLLSFDPAARPADAVAAERECLLLSSSSDTTAASTLDRTHTGDTTLVSRADVVRGTPDPRGSEETRVARVATTEVRIKRPMRWTQAVAIIALIAVLAIGFVHTFGDNIGGIARDDAALAARKATTVAVAGAGGSAAERTPSDSPNTLPAPELPLPAPSDNTPLDPQPAPDPRPEPKQPKPAAPKPAIIDTRPGTVICDLKQWAEITIDGKSVGKKQLQSRLTLEPGDHTLTFTNPAGKMTRVVKVKPASEQTLIVDIKP